MFSFFDFKPKKSLGQNFLIDKNILPFLINSANLSPNDLVLEIGAGKGILTEALVEKCKVISLEIDKELVKYLQMKFKNHLNIEIIHQDILKLDLSLFIKQKIKKQNYKLVANLPYYISTRIVQDFLTLKKPPISITVMLQKEVGEKMLQKPPEMNYFSLLVQLFAKAKIIKKVSKNCFYPKPKVDSIIMHFKTHTSPFLLKKEQENFLDLIKAGFSNKRKTLINSLKQNLSAELKQKDCLKVFKTLKLNKTIRAQELELTQWMAVFKSFCHKP